MPAGKPIEELGDVHLVGHGQIGGHGAGQPGGEPREKPIHHLRSEISWHRT